MQAPCKECCLLTICGQCHGLAVRCTGQVLKAWCSADNKQSLEVEFEHLVMWSTKLALAVVDAPKTVLGILDAAAKEAVLEDWPEFSNIHQEIFVRFPTLSVVDSIRNLRCAQGVTIAGAAHPLLPIRGRHLVTQEHHNQVKTAFLGARIALH